MNKAFVSLNPYSTGIYSVSGSENFVLPGHVRLNPYSTGIYSVSGNIKQRNRYYYLGLNPYSTGIYSVSDEKPQQ